MRCSPELVVDKPGEVAAWVTDRLPNVGEWLRWGYIAVGMQRRGKMCGGVIFSKMQPDRSNIEMSAVGSVFVSKKIVLYLMDVAFGRLRVAHVEARTSGVNIRAQKGLEGVGFVCEGVQRLAWDGTNDAVLYGMTQADAAAWVKENAYGQQ